MAIGSPQWMYKSGEAYTVDQSLKYEGGRTTYLSKTPTSSGNRKTSTFSTWVKISPAAKSGGQDVLFEAYEDNANRWSIFIGDNANNYIGIFGETGDSADVSLHTDSGGQVFRDYSAWYHIMFVLDTTQSTASDRAKIYVNGVQPNVAATPTYPSQNSDLILNKNVSHHLGAGSWSGAIGDYYFSGNMAETYFIDGQALTPADFGETGDYGEWKPKEYSGTYGTNGFYLPFKNDYTLEGFSATTYKGEGGTRYVGGTGFRPSLNWIKRLNGNGSNRITDIVRGANKTWMSDDTGTEYVGRDTSAFKPDGFTNGGNSDDSGDTYVAWSWDMGANTPTGFGAVAYKGSGSADQVVGDMGFSPDLLWIKDRTNANSHHIFDKVRGVNQRIRSDSDAAEDSSNDSQRAFLPDGFRLGATGTGITVSGNDYVAWGWNMGGTSASNTDGSITSTVMANTTYGQSIVKYTGSSSASTVGHGLSSAPEVVITKRRDDTSNWGVYHTSNGATKYQLLNSTEAAGTTTAMWNDTAPTNSVFSIGTDNDTNGSSKDYIAYCFHSVSGYSKFGTYSGSGGSGNAQTLGFRPAFLMVKRTDSTSDWAILDSTRAPLNPVDKALRGNANNAEDDLSSNYQVTFTDTGFSFSNYGYNETGSTYIYMAFAGGVDSMSAFNTDGTSESRVKANTTYGQSIVTYKGKSGAQTVGHGLSSTPEMIIAKNRSSAQEWLVYHHSLTDAKDKYLRLDTTGAVADNTFWNDTAPTSSVFSVGDSQPINSGHGNDYVAYCFHSVTGYSKFGSYTGNGSTTGTSVTTGFKPAWLLIKRTTDEGWQIVDSTRNPNNTLTTSISPNSNAAERDDLVDVDFTSTGFQLKGTDGSCNASGGTYIYMAFADKREYAYWLDQSGQNNDWISNNLTESDISVDSPTNNFATLNPLDVESGQTLSEGNLKTVLPDNKSSIANMFVSSGKWYFEVLHLNKGSSGIISESLAMAGKGDSNVNGETGAYNLSIMHGTMYYNNGQETTPPVGNDGDIVGVAFDLDNNKIYWHVNGVYSSISGGQQNPTTAANPISITQTTEAFAPMMGAFSTNPNFVANFGQDSSFAGNKTAQGNQDSNDIGDFYYEPPTGFLALCTDNLPTPAVTPSENFNTVLWSGDGGSNRALTGFGFQPDFVFIKTRNQTNDPNCFDSVRGATKVLRPSTTSAEFTDTTSVKSFDSDGITVGNAGDYNASGNTYVGWNWKAGTSVSGNSTGSGDDIAYTGSVSTDAGFSIIKYGGNNTAGHQIPHHLGVVPDAIWIKSLTTQSWQCFFPNTVMGATKGLQLDNTGAWGTVSHLNNTMPSTSVVTLGTGAATNTKDGSDNPQPYIMYSWANKSGYSSIGGYVGNGNADGPFVYTGFKPAFLLIKVTGLDGEGWGMWDSARDIDNVVENRINADSSNAENSNDDWLDFLSNGFKIRETNSQVNSNGYTYVYMAFAENPFKYSNGR